MNVLKQENSIYMKKMYCIQLLDNIISSALTLSYHGQTKYHTLAEQGTG